MFSVILFPESVDATSVGALGTSIVAIICFAIYAFHRISKTITKIRLDARLAEKERQDEVQDKIKSAVETERHRWLEQKEDEAERINRLRDIASEWRSIAEQKDARNRIQEEELRKVHEELAELRKLYIESQSRIAALEEIIRRGTGPLQV